MKGYSKGGICISNIPSSPFPCSSSSKPLRRGSCHLSVVSAREDASSSICERNEVVTRKEFVCLSTGCFGRQDTTKDQAYTYRDKHSLTTERQQETADYDYRVNLICLCVHLASPMQARKLDYGLLFSPLQACLRVSVKSTSWETVGNQFFVFHSVHGEKR